MSVNEILNLTKQLNSKEKYLLIDTLILNLHNIDNEIEQQWLDESQKRLDMYDNGKLETVSFEEVFS
jgi:hypothetical protein